ncbi:hypothetical protein AA0481_0558 [Acetobacter orientalis NRIC 0481]|uniref:Uncharacterized protein n=1 Tax=Acetobacter orientalis TaxID=146474 RepID=A0A0D6NMR1_9PROT|nr:hypothetical protein Abor_031_081 [Acetobacter orientalis]GBR14228.1 hypothetical protein AA0481_0558 [Acetobacter orientalis NRIC 0481]GEL60840.1 hypothetical protein AOR02nite_06820 [Acetobacter orientalis]
MNSRLQINEHNYSREISGKTVNVVYLEINRKFTFGSITVNGLPPLRPMDGTFHSRDEIEAEVIKIVNNMKS